jgi:hypothetical protein
MSKTFRIWAFGFRYCLVFSASARDELGRVGLEFGFVPNVLQRNSPPEIEGNSQREKEGR